jgi:hypothetical protein
LENSANTVTFAWNGIFNAPDNLITDRGTASSPACIKVKPPINTTAAMWFDPNSPGFTSALFTIQCPSNTVLDIDFEYILGNGTTTPLVLSANAADTGVMYLELIPTLTIPDGLLITGHI